jgi:hypothetical protein
MTDPEKVLIPHDDFAFETVGRFADGRQFMAFVSGAYPGEHRLVPKNWLDVKRWIVVIHIFDADGNHLTTEAHLIGFAREEPHLHTKIDTMFVALLSDYKIIPSMYCDIWIKPFHTVVDDIYYEFVYEREEDGDEIYEQMALWPNDVVFYPPWNDGYYDT